jgi:hypothetical protein
MAALDGDADPVARIGRAQQKERPMLRAWHRTAALAVVALAAAVPAAAADTTVAAPPATTGPPSSAAARDLARQALQRPPASRSSRAPAPPRRHGRRTVQRKPTARAAGVFDRYWTGAGVSCVGRYVTVGVSANATFGLAPATRAYWRSQLYVYNPTTGARGWIAFQYYNNHFVTAQERYLGNGWVVTAHGINPQYGTQQTWQINPGWWVRPAIEVYNWLTYGVAIDRADWFDSPNWCYIA